MEKPPLEENELVKALRNAYEAITNSTGYPDQYVLTVHECLSHLIRSGTPEKKAREMVERKYFEQYGEKLEWK